MSDTAPLFASRAVRPGFDLRAISGFTDNVIRRIEYKLGRGAAMNAAICENPYCLTAIWGIGFKMADRVATALGVPRNAKVRQAAAATFVLGEAESEGHSCLPTEDFAFRVSAELGGPLLEGCEIDDNVTVQGGSFSLTKTWEAERRAASILTRLLANSVPPLVSVLDGLAEDQAAALRAIQAAGVFCLLGSPGTGKTTLIRALVGSNSTSQIAVCAPTGKAAKRVEQATGHQATTIHRLLKVDPYGDKDNGSHSLNFAFQFNAKHKLPQDLVIVDESSMVDIRLFADLLEALRPDARLVLIGDTHQLPSVGPGRVLSDLVASGEVPYTELTQLKRQDPTLQIARNCARLKAGEVPAIDNANFVDFFFIPVKEAGDIANEIVSLQTERLPKKYGIDGQRDIVTLTALREGRGKDAPDPVLSAAGLNARLRKVFNPSAPADKKEFAQGDRVIQLTNNYQFDVMNGDTGTVMLVENKSIAIDWDTPRRSTMTSVKELNLAHAWALTVHKFQGSEIPWAIIPIHKSNGSMVATRQHLYTALSRGKQGVVIVGDYAEMEAVVARVREQRRFTRLAALLQEGGA